MATWLQSTFRTVGIVPDVGLRARPRPVRTGLVPRGCYRTSLQLRAHGPVAAVSLPAPTLITQQRGSGRIFPEPNRNRNRNRSFLPVPDDSVATARNRPLFRPLAAAVITGYPGGVLWLPGACPPSCPPPGSAWPRRPCA